MLGFVLALWETGMEYGSWLQPGPAQLVSEPGDGRHPSIPPSNLELCFSNK